MTARKFALGYCKISVDHIEDCYTRCFIPSVLIVNQETLREIVGVYICPRNGTHVA